MNIMYGTGMLWPEQPAPLPYPPWLPEVAPLRPLPVSVPVPRRSLAQLLREAAQAAFERGDMEMASLLREAWLRQAKAEEAP